MRKMRKLALVLAMTVCVSCLGAQPSFAQTPRDEVAQLQNELNQISQSIEANNTDGAYVNKGDVIGYVGTTGRSGGNHLHFEVNLNGAVVTPWTYLNG